jgi:predicted nucleotidyltransferase
MTATWLDLSYPLDPCLDRLLRDLDDQLQARNLLYLLTGGMAREILLHYGYGCVSGRETTDVDFGVTLSDWEAFENLKVALTTSGLFRADPKATQRVFHINPDNGMVTKVDLVPFGMIAGPDGQLSWPPDGSHVMSVLGYDQAMSTAVHLRLDDTRWVPLASALGIAVMKLVAWVDRGEARKGRDAVDFLEVLRQHFHLLTDKEKYDDYPEAMETYDFREEPAAAWILGRRVAEQSDARLMGVILTAIEPGSRVRMRDYFLRERDYLDSADREAEADLLLEAFEKGLQSGVSLKPE